jgi:hypothetical protein
MMDVVLSKTEQEREAMKNRAAKTSRTHHESQ